MQIRNKTRGTLLADKAIMADTPFKRIKGLLGRQALREGEALILKPCNCVHTFFMRFPIDCLFVDKNKRVIKMISHLNPFRITGLCFSSSMVIELPLETIRNSATQEGDTFSF